MACGDFEEKALQSTTIPCPRFFFDKFKEKINKRKLSLEQGGGLVELVPIHMTSCTVCVPGMADYRKVVRYSKGCKSLTGKLVKPVASRTACCHSYCGGSRWFAVRYALKEARLRVAPALAVAQVIEVNGT